MPARVSTRISIAWPPAPPSEPTDTLVLGVGGWYVDLRMTKDDLIVDWAMAGERIVVPGNPGEFTNGDLLLQYNNKFQISSMHVIVQPDLS